MDVVVVAGGRGRRLGRDKALVPRGDDRQVDVVVAAVRPLGGVVVVAHGARVLDLPATVGVADEPDLVGPLAGLVAGLRVATSDVVAVVAVDLVRPDADLLLALATHARDHDLPGAMPVVDDRPQPLHAVVRRNLADSLATAGPRLVTALDAVGVHRVPESTWLPWTPTAQPAHDLDTPADLTALLNADPPPPEPRS